MVIHKLLTTNISPSYRLACFDYVAWCVDRVVCVLVCFFVYGGGDGMGQHPHPPTILHIIPLPNPPQKFFQFKTVDILK